MRKPVNRRRGARKFNKQVRKTKTLNVKQPGRGGYRL